MPTAKRKKIKLTGEQQRALRDQPEPSAESLKLIPEARKAKYMGRGPEGVKAALDYIHAKRGRPAQGEKAAGSSSRSLRLTDATWEALERVAKKRHTTVHALLRQAVAETLSKAG